MVSRTTTTATRKRRRPTTTAVTATATCQAPRLAFPLAALLVSFLPKADGTVSSTAPAGSEEEAYVRYAAYPEHCSTPDQLERRRIPPLATSSGGSTTRVVHVTVVSRHGARAPKGKHECWPSYFADVGVDTAVWDCDDMTTVVGGVSGMGVTSVDNTPSSSSAWSSFNVATAAAAIAHPLFLQLRYDGLPSARHQSAPASAMPGSPPPPRRLSSSPTNILNGTCQVAQLLRKGYDQHLWNGQMLRSTYMDDNSYENGSNESADATSSSTKSLKFLPSHRDPRDYIYFRSDDEQRTIASGQALLLGLLGQTSTAALANASFPIHTADKVRDVMSDNDDLCERLKELEDKAYDSKEYKHLEKEFRLKDTKDWMKGMFGYKLKKPLQCLMTAMCNDLTLPDALNDYSTKDGNFQRLAEYELVQKNFVYGFDSAAYAKLAMGPLWNEMLRNIRRALGGSDAVRQSHGLHESDRTLPSPMLAYYSGHDSTISQLLSSLGSKVWTLTDEVPYASLMVIEVHQLVGDSSGDDEAKADGDDNKGDDDDDDAERRMSKSSDWSRHYMFRLLFNGHVLTPAIKHCHEELCELRILLDRLKDVATDVRHCRRKHPVEEQVTNDAGDSPNDDAAAGIDATKARTEEGDGSIPIARSPVPSLVASRLWMGLIALLAVAAGSATTWMYLLHTSSSPASFSDLGIEFTSLTISQHESAD